MMKYILEPGKLKKEFLKCSSMECSKGLSEEQMEFKRFMETSSPNSNDYELSELVFYTQNLSELCNSIIFFNDAAIKFCKKLYSQKGVSGICKGKWF